MNLLPRRAFVACALLSLATLASAPLRAQSTKRILATEHGIVGDGQTVNTKALQAAIDRISAEGGGTLVIPSGTFISGALYFKQGVNLHIEKDGVLKSTINQADFPPIYTRWEGIERYWSSAFLNFVGVKNVTVSGEGTIDGSGDAFAGFGQRARGGPGAGAPGATKGGAEGATKGGPDGAAKGGAAAAGRGPGGNGGGAPTGPLPTVAEVYGTKIPTTATINFAPDPAKLPIINAAGLSVRGNPSPPRAVVFQNCSNVRVSNLNLKNQARWGWVFIYCQDVIAENLKVRAEHYIPSSDGFDVDSCRKVLITGADIDVNDDCISLKSGKDEDGRRVNIPCEDIIIEKTRFAYGHGGAAMGSETSGGIHRVEVRDCVVEADNWAPIRFKSQPTRGGVVEDITYRNIEIRNARQAFEFNLEWNMRIAIPGAGRAVPTVRNVKIINVWGTVENVGTMHGLTDSLIDGITFENCNITATKRGLTIDNAKNVNTAGLKITVPEGVQAITVK